eukprot:710989-Pyramimonas_sp.AAC.1
MAIVPRWPLHGAASGASTPPVARRGGITVIKPSARSATWPKGPPSCARATRALASRPNTCSPRPPPPPSRLGAARWPSWRSSWPRCGPA